MYNPRLSRSPALGSDPRLRARLPDRAGNPQRAGGAHGSLVQYAIPRAGGEARHAKGERMEGGEYACSFFFESIFFIFYSAQISAFHMHKALNRVMIHGSNANVPACSHRW